MKKLSKSDKIIKNLLLDELFIFESKSKKSLLDIKYIRDLKKILKNYEG
jgi:hypothetical protein